MAGFIRDLIICLWIRHALVLFSLFWLVFDTRQVLYKYMLVHGIILQRSVHRRLHLVRRWGNFCLLQLHHHHILLSIYARGYWHIIPVWKGLYLHVRIFILYYTALIGIRSRPAVCFLGRLFESVRTYLGVFGGSLYGDDGYNRLQDVIQRNHYSRG